MSVTNDDILEILNGSPDKTMKDEVFRMITDLLYEAACSRDLKSSRRLNESLLKLSEWGIIWLLELVGHIYQWELDDTIEYLESKDGPLKRKCLLELLSPDWSKDGQTEIFEINIAALKKGFRMEIGCNTENSVSETSVQTEVTFSDFEFDGPRARLEEKNRELQSDLRECRALVARYQSEMESDKVSYHKPTHFMTVILDTCKAYMVCPIKRSTYVTNTDLGDPVTPIRSRRIAWENESYESGTGTTMAETALRFEKMSFDILGQSPGEYPTDS